jgi:hypothetical protein
MTNFEKITENPTTLARFLGGLPVLEGPWDKAFHDNVCANCNLPNCEDETCPAPTILRDAAFRAGWWLGLEAEE